MKAKKTMPKGKQPTKPKRDRPAWRQYFRAAITGLLASEGTTSTYQHYQDMINTAESIANMAEAREAQVFE